MIVITYSSLDLRGTSIMMVWLSFIEERNIDDMSRGHLEFTTMAYSAILTRMIFNQLWWLITCANNWDLRSGLDGPQPWQAGSWQDPPDCQRSSSAIKCRHQRLISLRNPTSVRWVIYTRRSRLILQFWRGWAQLDPGAVDLFRWWGKKLHCVFECPEAMRGTGCSILFF